MNIRDALDLRDKGVISIIGAGGKTSLMYSLARELVARGKKVLTTTTTKIFIPKPDESPATIVDIDSDKIVQNAIALLQEYSHLTVASEYIEPQNKLRGLDPSVIKYIKKFNLFDFIIIEADGAAQRSLKSCASHEPVVPEFSDYIIALAGLDVLAKPLTEEFVFRSNIFSEITGLDLLENITEDAIALAIIHDIFPLVGNRNCMKMVFLNKADNLKTVKAGERVVASLKQKGRGILNRIVIGELRGETAIHQCTVMEQGSHI